MDLADVLWIGGPRNSGTRELADALAQRFDLTLYSVEEQAAAHAQRMPIAGDASAHMTARHRFRLVLEDLRVLEDKRGAIVEGEELLPTSVSAVLRFPDQALFLVPAEGGVYAWEARDLRLRALAAEQPFEELAELAAAHFAPAVQRFRR